MRKWTPEELIAMQADKEYDDLKADGYRSPLHKWFSEEVEYYNTLEGQADRAKRWHGDF